MTDSKKDGKKDGAADSRLLSLLDLIGIKARPGKQWHVSLRPRFFILFAAGAASGMIFGIGMTKYSTSPGFCKSCHIMKPYYDAWKNSKHKDVACVECHYPPAKAQTLAWKKFQALSQVAKYVTRTYSSKPYAEVDDASCLRSGCHDKRLLEGKVVTASGIKFDHRPHLTETQRGRRLKCVSCHSQMVMGKHIEVSYDTCYLCHFKGKGEGRDLKPLGGCLGCHDLPKKTFAIGSIKYNHKDFVTKRNIACNNCHLDVLSGKGEAPQDRCFTCHNQPEKLARYKDVPLIHDNHVTKHNVACFHCHREIRHGYVEDDGSRMAGLHKENKENEPPSAGHMGVMKFDCAYCHTNTHAGQQEMYTGEVSSLGLKDMPSPMYLANVDCVGCHYRENPGDEEREFRGRTMLPSRESCVKCHGKSFTGIWDEVRKELRGTLSKLGNKLEKASAALKKAELSKKDRARLETDLATARRWQGFVRASHGEHNIYLSSYILRRENSALDKLGEALKTALPDISTEPLISGNYCATMCHQRVGVKVPAEFMKVGKKKMPHKEHAESKGGCVDCHDVGAHKKMPLKKNAKKTVCAECHGGGM